MRNLFTYALGTLAFSIAAAGDPALSQDHPTTSFTFRGVPTHLTIQSKSQPSSGQAAAAAALASLRDQYRAHPRPRSNGGSAPPTLEQLIQDAEGSDPPYSQTLGTGARLDQDNFPDLAVFDFNADTVFPGVIVQGKPQFIEAGQLVLNPLPRAAGSLVITGVALNPAVPTSVHLTSATLPAISQAVNTLANSQFKPDQAPPWSCEYSTVSSSRDASFSAGLSFGYQKMVSLSNTFSSADDSTKNHILIKCSEHYYTILFTPDQQAGFSGDAAFFNPTLSVDQARQYIGLDNPPLFVQSVTYGAELFFLSDSTTSSSQMQDALKAAFSYAGVSGSAELTDAQKATLATLDVHILAIGGRASAQLPLITDLTGPSVADGLVKYLQQTLNVAGSGGAEQETGLPISYKLSFLDFTPVTETLTILGTPTQSSDSPLTFANIQFQQDGNGKGKDTLVDIAIEDASGRAIGYGQIGPNTGWGNNFTGPVINVPIVASGTKAALSGGNLHLTIHPAQHDVWKFTAYLRLGYQDGSSQFGQFSDELSSDQTVTVTDPDGKKVSHNGRELLKSLADVEH